MSQWKAGLVVAVMSGVLGVGCGGDAPVEASTDERAVDRYTTQMEQEDWGQCGKKICFDPIERDKNITHIFIDFGDCRVRDFRVFLETEHRGKEEVTDRLKTQGGPCQELDADYRFEVQGPDKEAKVCIIFEDYVPKHVRLGAKAANDCSYEDDDDLRVSWKNECKKCN
ncbi:hypothetical protein JY651_36900 [Pyxidicoccus parkwayensis]|uniref:Lipoprotein n=1 Tax=Pyxidicoccus parkwayensis TaxID=2813578 RepID=A0ABX7NQZ6_9BACT|nr:hypothetical protein [Pyxidicoccus parkwaysis]QSQ20769.1 hypothetical protein JY651_36900 [Pyxidicoccus parkwaysis]